MWDEEPKILKQKPLAEQLAPLSVADLEARIEALRAEIAACEVEIARKQSVASAAESLFKK